jgi:hypothetical protein
MKTANSRAVFLETTRKKISQLGECENRRWRDSGVSQPIMKKKFFLLSRGIELINVAEFYYAPRQSISGGASGVAVITCPKT